MPKRQRKGERGGGLEEGRSQSTRFCLTNLYVAVFEGFKVDPAAHYNSFHTSRFNLRASLQFFLINSFGDQYSLLLVIPLNQRHCCSGAFRDCRFFVRVCACVFVCLRSLHYVILRGRKIGTTKNNLQCIFSTAKRGNLKPGKGHWLVFGGHGLKNTDPLEASSLQAGCQSRKFLFPQMRRTVTRGSSEAAAHTNVCLCR